MGREYTEQRKGGGGGREGKVMTPKGSVQEMGRPYFVVSKWEEESDGASNQDLAAVRRGKLRGYEESNSVPMTT